jgi:Na+-transporting NADH:ubiquinone oxidoreductase subunit NqrB
MLFNLFTTYYNALEAIYNSITMLSLKVVVLYTCILGHCPIYCDYIASYHSLVRVTGHTLLISAYFDASLDPNPNLKRDFPHIPWRGEIAVLFVGKRKSFVRRAPPDPVVRSAVAR